MSIEANLARVQNAWHDRPYFFPSRLRRLIVRETFPPTVGTLELMPNDFDVIIIGVGAMGAATCFELARRGVKVLGIEQFDIPHNRGSSHGHSRMIRMAYYEQPAYVPLLRRAYALWDQLETLSGRRLLHRTGGLYIGPGGGMLVDGSRKSAIAHHLEHEMLTRDELCRRWPQFHVPQDWSALFEWAAGFLLPEQVISSFVDLALRDGAKIHARERVISWEANEARVHVTTDRATYQADQLIFTGGAWSGKLIADLGVPLVVTRQVLGWVWPRNPEMFQIGQLPAWGIDSLDGGMFYGFPMYDDVPGLKVAHHLPGTAIDPDRPNPEPTADDEKDFRAALKYIPDADSPLVAMRTCMYTVSPDHDFIIDRHPLHPRVHIACGFSGHGFKFASVVGEILADLATTGRTKLPIEFLSIRRFGEMGLTPV
jgi:sarcosine oxidase